MDNPVSILVRGVPEAEIKIETSENLTIKKEGSISYTVRASTPGEGTIIVSGGNLKPLTFRYRVKRIPDPTVLLGAQLFPGTISSGTFQAQKGIAALLLNFDMDARCDMLSYKVIQVRNGQFEAEVSNTGVRFTTEARTLINKAEPGDIYIFENVKVKCPGDIVSRDMGSLTFVIR